MKYKNLFILALLFCTTVGFSQVKTLYSEDFSKKSGWPTGNNSTRELAVKNGKYYFEYKKSTGYWNVTTTPIEFDTSKDFEIETSIQKLTGKKQYAYGLLFGYKNNDNTYHFMLSLDGQYRVSEKRNGTYNEIKKWSSSSSIRKGYYDYNKLKIKKTGSTLYFYINNTLVTSTKFKPFFDNKIGVMVYNKQKIATDYLKVNQLSETTTNPVVNNNSNNSIFNDTFSNNANKWYIENTNNVETKLSNGKYYFEHKRAKAGWSSTLGVPINTSKDFQISTTIQKISGVNNNGFGIVFGRKDGDNQYVFSITSNGYYSIDKYVNGKYLELVKWTKNNAVKTGNYAYNTLAVKKENGVLKFYLNNSYLTQLSFNGFSGNRFGYVIYKNQKIAIDNLSISYINSTNPVVQNNDLTTQGTTIFQDYFSSNTNKWPVGNTEEKNISIANNYYNFDHKRDKGGWMANIVKKFDSSKDFEISTKIRKVSGVDNYAYGILWGKKDKNEFRFSITGNGYYKIGRTINDKEELIKKFTKTSYINKGNGVTNTLTIKKTGGVNKFYINNNFVAQTDFEPFFGDRIGYIVYSKQKIAVDYLTIKSLKTKTNTIVTNNTLKVPLAEEFASNNNGWSLTNTNDVVTRINNGKLYIKSNNEKSGAFISKRVDINTGKDFIIETEITRLTNSNASIALVFGRKNNTNEYDLFLSKDSYLFRKLENDQSIKSIPWTTTATLNATVYEPNKIKIVKKGNLLRFYINGTYVNEAPYSPFFGNYLGFSVYNKQEISINYLKISYPSNTDFNAPPEVVITEPIVERGFKIVKTKKILVKGKATDKDGIYEIVVNGIDATVLENGTFTANVPLKFGNNDLVVKATDLKQASSTKTFTIKRKSPIVNNDDVVVVNNNDKNNLKFGNYYALIIGVSNYGDGAITDLGGLPTKDAKDLADILIAKYNFKKKNVVLLNNSPKANDIIKQFSILKKRVTKNDNLLVFYAGHGVYDEISQVGSWLPSDADMEYELNLISNSQVVDFLKAIQSKHTLLISDACFSGSIFKTREFKKAPKSVQKKYELKSRKAITSGTLKTVPNKSVFLKYLLDRLEKNTSHYLSSRQLFNNIEEPVMNNSPNTPQFGTIYGIGDEGGDFIFIKN